MKELISCTLCKHPQCVDFYEMQLTLTKSTNITINQRDLHQFDCICHRCTQTDEYKREYIFNKKHHLALTPKTEVRKH